MSKNIYYIFALLFMLFASGSYAQSNKPTVVAKFSPDSIAIGDQFELEVTVEKDMVQLIEFPKFDNNKLGETVEILSESGVDTLSKDGRKLKLSKRYKLTVFDEGRYSFEKFPMLFMDKNIVDTIWSKDSLFLEVSTFEIDTTKQVIMDIKEPLETPLKFGEVSGYISLGIIVIALITLLIIYIIRRRANKPLFGKTKTPLPPHVIAIKALEELKNRKIWQSDIKLYYTSVTDILREYLEGRYGIHAMEMISDEILSAINELELSQKNSSNIKDLLATADLVKFAKVQPDMEMTERHYEVVYFFVEDTKNIENEPIEDKETI